MVLPTLSASSCKLRSDGAGIGEPQSKGERKTLPVLLGHPQRPLSSGEKRGGPNAPILTTLVGEQGGEQPNYPDGERQDPDFFSTGCSAKPLPSSGD